MYFTDSSEKIEHGRKSGKNEVTIAIFIAMLVKEIRLKWLLFSNILLFSREYVIRGSKIHIENG